MQDSLLPCFVLYLKVAPSRACLLPAHVCDGVPHCPRQDDEIACDVTCPAQCACRGLAYACRRPFPAHQHPSARRLDLAHTGMTLAALASSLALVSLSL